MNIVPRITYFLNDFAFYIAILAITIAGLPFLVFKIYKSGVRNRQKKLYIITIITFFFFILIFTAFEMYFRYIYDESDGLGFLKVNERWQKRHVVTNNYFFRDKDFELVKKEGITRIGVLGDSITFGGGIKNVDDRFSNILEKKLKTQGANVEVYNLGSPGYDTEGEIEQYQKVKHLDFDIIIWQYFLNDIQPKDASTGTPIIAKNSHRAKILEFISDKSFFLDFLYWRFSTAYDKTIVAFRSADIEQYKNQAVLKQHKDNITYFISSLKSDNKKVIMIMFPSLYSVDGNNYPTFVNDIMETIFRENKVDAINLYYDLRGLNPKVLMAGRFDAHPNESVHKLAAEKLFEKVTPLLK